jgi:short-subunit dehydrogenase
MRYRTALITGASSGIGEAIARALPQGTRLLLTGRDPTRLETLAGDLLRAGQQVTTMTADLATETGVDDLVAWATPHQPDLLVSNAGFGRFGKALEQAEVAQCDETMVKLNVLAPVALTRALVPGMLQRARAENRRAGLIYVASTIAFHPMPYLATYSASKHFLRAYVESIAGEMRREPVDILALCPGVTRTSFLERAGIPLPPYATMDEPETVARVALATIGRRRVRAVGVQGHLAIGLARLLPRRLMVAALARIAESWR